MKTIHAVYANGVFRPKEKVGLPEQCEVAFAPKVIRRSMNGKRAVKNGNPMQDIYKILSRRYDTGRSDIARRHNEHQP